jgi:pimeloyl-ACP methyl ester carboxylesterase
MAASLPLVLLPGLGADHRLFQAQTASLAGLITPDWIDPARDETLETYAKRMAGVVDPGGPCIVGGASFGGMVALEMARYLEARACLLIGSIRSREELPKWVRAAKPLISATPSWLMGTAPGAALALRATAGRLAGPRVRSLLEQFGGTSGRFLRWALLAMLRWETLAKPLSIPVFHIHGDRDHVLPHRLTRPDVVVPDAGHLLMLTYPKAVNEFLESHRTQLSGSES